MIDKSEIITYGSVKNGVPHMTKKEEFLKSIVARFPEGVRFIWAVRPVFKKRSNPLNRYYWGVILDCFIRGYEESQGHEMSFEYVNRETGEILHIPMSKKDKFEYAHNTLKTLYNEGNSTTELTNSQCMDYQQLCREHIKFCFNIYVPLPNEPLEIF